MKYRALIIFIILCIWPVANLWAFYEMEGDRFALSARGAVDFSTGFNDYPRPRLLHPSTSEGFESMTARLLMDALVNENMRFEANAYQEIHSLADTIGSAFTYEPYRTKRLRRKVIDDDKVKSTLSLDQISMKIYSKPVDITIGRQPISLANNFIFTPNDLFYPFASTAVDREFRPGVDAFRLDIMTGMLSRITIIGVLGYERDGCITWDRSAGIFRESINWQGFDWSVLGGKVDGRHLTGLAFSGEAMGQGVRMEGNMSFPTEQGEDRYLQLSLGIDHRWKNSLHLMVEYYYHGNGKTDPMCYPGQIMQETYLADPFLGKYYLGVTLKGDATALITLQGTALINLKDPSYYLSPAIVYSAGDEVEFIAGMGIPAGRKPGILYTAPMLPDIRSEYGSYPVTIYLQGRFYF